MSSILHCVFPLNLFFLTESTMTRETRQVSSYENKALCDTLSGVTRSALDVS